mmetsp:Transcript_17457/g.30068  ORF Transcript_17457/g.30068 Transcript_17457/m.30068 type:complete len:317 (+) Transcript_17457:687-1637(+)
MSCRSSRSTLKALAMIACGLLLLVLGAASFRIPIGYGISRSIPSNNDSGADFAFARPGTFSCVNDAGVTSNKYRRSLHTTGPLFTQPSTGVSTDDEEKELTPATIAEMIEVSFLQSCLQLSQGYIDVLKLFIVAVKAGYERSLPLDELHQLVETCPVNSAGRDLMKEEKELRFEWMKVVYEMMNALNPDLEDVSASGGLESDESNILRITEVVKAMVAIQGGLQREEETTGGKQDATVAVNNLTVEQALERSSSLSKLNESITNPMEKAFFTNDIRVALMTFRVLEEEKVCMQDASGRTVSASGGGEAPRAPIPGT